jgi:hypothetical protein
MKLTSTRVAVLGAVSALALGSAVSARAEEPRPGNDGARAGKEFGWVAAKWRCAEKWAPSEYAPAYESTSTLTGTNEIDGVWVTWTYVQDPSPANPHPSRGADIWGYDPQKKEFLREKVDTFAPGKVTHLSSKGWSGDSLSWDGQAGTPKGMKAFRHLIKKVDDRSIEMHIFIDGHAVYESKCTRG